MIQAIFFDFYNTLARFYPLRDQLQATACAHFDIAVTAEGIDKGYALADAFMAQENAILPLRKRSAEAREDFFAEYEQLILRGAGIEVPRETARQIWLQIRQLKYDIGLFEDVLPTLHLLKEQRITLGVISNINRDMQKLMDDLKLSPYLDFAVTSSEVGTEKPHAPIFLAALDKAGLEPGEAIHVGDQLDSDVEGARAVGINPVLLDRYTAHPGYQGCPRIKSLMELHGLLADYLDNSLPE